MVPSVDCSEYPKSPAARSERPGEFEVVSGTLLATLTFSDPAFGAASSGVATASAITSDTSADASGDAGHFRVKDSNGNVIFQGTAGEVADTCDMTFDEKSVVATGTIACSSFTVTVPAS